MTEANFSTFLHSWSLELAAQANRVRNLIGDAHWLSDGNHKEAILRAFLRRYLPASAVVSSGFILAPDATRRVSPQVDVLVCDLSVQTPFLLESELAIVPPAAVLAHVEVKSTLCSSVAKDAMVNVFQTRIAIGRRAVWSGAVFFATGSTDPVVIARWLGAALKVPVAQAPAALDLASVKICLVVVGEFVAYLDELSESGFRLRVFSERDIALAFGMLDLVSAVREKLGGRPIELIDELALDRTSKPYIDRITFEN